MPNFRFKARNNQGQLIQGVMTAQSSSAVAEKLKANHQLPVFIQETKNEINLKNILSFNQPKVKFSDLNLFTRSLYTLQKAGVILTSSLMTVKEQTTNEYFKNVITQIIRDIESGVKFSAALARHPNVFNHLYVNLIEAGETGGRLVEVLERLSIMGEADEKINMRVKEAMRYPLIVVLAICLGFIILVTFVMPKFIKLYAQFNTELPFPTKVLIAISYSVTHFWWLIILSIMAVFWYIKRFLNTNSGRQIWDETKLKIPIFGQFFLKLTMSRFTRVTGVLLKSGLPILQILELASQSVGNVVVSKAILEIKNSVNRGQGMLEPMKRSGLFPPIVIQMVSVGEESGQMDELLLHVADYYENQVNYTINNLVALIEPLLILGLGVSVLFFALGVFLPLWNLSQLFKH